MNATDLLLAAYGTAMNSNEEIHKKWISVSFALAGIAGNAHLIALQRNGRLDLMLRLLESERLGRMQDGPSHEPVWSLDLQCSLSANWVISTYETLRAAKEKLKAGREGMPKLLKVEHRLALVRMPIAKGEIQGMNQKANKDNPPMLIRADEASPEPYQEDGSYMPPLRLCAETGAVVWHPVDMTKRETVAICRRDLSDEVLALFE